MSEDRVRFYPKMSSLLDSASSESQIELAQAIQSIPQGVQIKLVLSHQPALRLKRSLYACLMILWSLSFVRVVLY